jgi:hypothetical protein
VYDSRGNPGGVIEAEAAGTVDAGAAKFKAKTGGSVQLCGGTVISTTKTDVPIGSSCIPGAPPCP